MACPVFDGLGFGGGPSGYPVMVWGVRASFGGYGMVVSLGGRDGEAWSRH